MNSVYKAFTIFTDWAATQPSPSPEGVQTQFGQPGWGVTPWTYCLFKDLIQLDGIRERSRRSRKGLSEQIALQLYFRKPDVHSFHYDFSKKVYLFKLLSQISEKDQILIPESGLGGFDIVVAKMAGFKKILAFDIEPEAGNLAKQFWGFDQLDFQCSDSESYSFQAALEKKIPLLIPDWPHGQIYSKLVKLPQAVNYAYGTPRNSHLKYLKPNDLEAFADHLPGNALWPAY